MGLKYFLKYIGRRKIGVEIETFQSAGRYIHKEYDIGLKLADQSERIPEEIVEAQRKLNESIYEYMPNGSGLVKSVVTYVAPKSKPLA